jgi:putative transcriptional regulator
MNMKLLRDLKESTTLLILLEITTGHHTKLKTIAEKLDITVQGVSEYLKRMTKDGLITHVRGEHRATNKGVELLHQRFLEIKDFVDESMKKLDIVNACTAIAGTSIKKGDLVGLIIEDGILTAYPNRKASSTGKAISSARKGEDIGIKDLEGITSLSTGKLWAIELPSMNSGGSRKVPLRKARELFERAKVDRVAALDLTGFSLIKRLKLKYSIEFAAPEATLEALQKGLDVMVFGSEDEVSRFISRVNEFNSGASKKISFRVQSIL